MTDQTPRQLALRRWGALKAERDGGGWLTHWKEINEYLLPRSGKFVNSDTGRGAKKHNNIYDSTGTRALRILAAGMMAGMTSPARPWFRLATSDPDLMEYGPVKLWLNDVSSLMRDIFSRSNTYRALHSLYEELGGYGTGVSIVADDYSDVIRHYPLTVGEYALATDARGEVDTLYREFSKSVAQIVGEFGLENCSQTVRDMHDKRNLDTLVPVIHAIEPRLSRDPGKRDAKNMPWRSVYFEAGANNDDKLLRESGFKDFPVLAARWASSGGDVYGSSPGMEALGDVKQLQQEQLRKSQGIDYMSNPPLQAPATYKDAGLDTLPGGLSFVDQIGPGGGIRTAFDVRLDLNHLLADIQDVRGRINSAFYADLFLMLANDQRSNITAREVAERHEEKLLMLGPVLERLHNELLDPKIEITFAKMLAAGIVPPPPRELQGSDLNVQFVSILAQAQRAVGLGAADRLIGVVASVSALKPETLDKLDGDQLIDAYADMLGADPSLIVADEKVALIRKNRAEAQAKAAQAQAVPAMAATAKTMSETDTSGQNALTDVMQRLTGYTGA